MQVQPEGNKKVTCRTKCVQDIHPTIFEKDGGAKRKKNAEMWVTNHDSNSTAASGR